MANHVAPDWDPRLPRILDDQSAAYDSMRETCPVAHSDFLGWSIFRHQEIEAVLEDYTTYSSDSKHRAVPNSLDPPEHTMYREVLDPFFTDESIGVFEAECRAIATGMTQDLLGSSEIEFVSQFAEPYSLRCLCGFMGWPEDSWEYLLGWTHGNQQVAFSRDRARGTALAKSFADYVLEAAAARRDGQDVVGDDVMSQLLRTTIQDRPINDEDLISALRNWTAGHGTVAAGLGIIALHIANDPDLQTRLRTNQSLVAAAVDEILRADGPLVANRRTTTRETELGGRTLPAGEKLTLMWMAANRDPDTFAEPATIDLERDQSQNYLYGGGIHYCVGAPLSRLELRIAVEALLAHTNWISPGDSEQVRRVIYPSNGMDVLPLRFE